MSEGSFAVASTSRKHTCRKTTSKGEKMKTPKKR